MHDASATTPSEIGAALCHCQALRQAARRLSGFYDAAMGPFGLRGSQFAMLVRLRQLGPSTVQALAQELVLDRTTLGRNLRPLERDGLVSSQGDPGDKRVRRLSISAAGIALMERATPAWHATQSGFEQQFGPPEAEALRAELQRLTRVVGSRDGAVREEGMPAEGGKDS